MPSTAVVLVIAATDSSGGAGLSRDVQTLSAFRVAARCAVTAVTVQTDVQVRAVQLLPPELVSAQIRASLDGGGIGAIKIGMLGGAATVCAVAQALPPREQIPIVLDPVLASSSGGRLLDRSGQELLCKLLLPRVTLLTPNLPEASALVEQTGWQAQASTPLASLQQPPALLQRLLALGPQAVLLKGGHDESQREARQGGGSVIDWLAIGGRGIVSMAVPRVRAQRRGTGCSAASAIAAQLALGQDLEQACRRAQTYVAELLRAQGPPAA